jgi:formylglycine-generating enzyme required for sulfatase activity
MKYFFKVFVATTICCGFLLSCTSSGGGNGDVADDDDVLICIADGVCNPDCQHDFDCNDDDVSEYNCEDTDGDGHSDYVFESCPQGDDYCSDDPNNWTLTGCESCIDSDGDGYGENCSRGVDCDDEDATIFADCPIICPGAPCGSDMVTIQAGCFEMGLNLDEMPFINDIPVHTVCLDAYEIDIHEATNAHYRECVEAAACSQPFETDSYTRAAYYDVSDFDDYPVIHIDWYDARDYCAWAGKRLPTEAEWEYAARGGLVGKYYPWGDELPQCETLNYAGSSCIGDTTTVGSYEANGFGLFDIAGNVEEWVYDRYNADYYSTLPSTVTNPTGPTSGEQRVVRGGSWGDAGYPLYVFYRRSGDADWESILTGFRCVR